MRPNKFNFILFLALICFNAVNAQLSDLHYLPPLKQDSNNIAIQQQTIYLSTPVTTAFTVNVYRGTSATPLTSFSLSKGTPATYGLSNGDNNITLVTNANTGVVLNNAGLRFESPSGEKFYVNYRGRSGSQAASITSKGRAALGQSFKWGGAPIEADHTSMSATLGIMATEDDTEVHISGYNTNCEFRLGADVDGITDNAITIILQQGESYVLEAAKDATTANIDGWIGASIESDKDIAISNGMLNFGVNPASASRDAGADQPVPEDKLGKDYVFVRGNGGVTNEYVIIIATQDNTNVYVNGNTTAFANIDEGEYAEIPSTFFSGVTVGSNMLVTTSKDTYAYQVLSGSSSIVSVSLNFVAPVNCLLPDIMDHIHNITDISGITATGGMFLIASTSTPDANITVQDGSGVVTLPASSAVAGTPDWKTFYISGLTGDVSVESTGPIAVGFIGFNGVRGIAGYFSGFDTVPEVNLQVAGGGCLPGADVEVIDETFDSYQWFEDGVLISGATSATYSPTTSADYYVRVVKGGCTYDSQPLSAYYCDPDVLINKTVDKDKVVEGETAIFTIEVQNLGVNPVTNLTVLDNIPSGLTLISSNPSVGSWSGNTWTIGTLNSGVKETIELEVQADQINTHSVTLTNTAYNNQTETDTNVTADSPSADITIYNYVSEASIDFDGVDDYLSGTSFVNGNSAVTIMAWIKSDSGNSTDMVVAGEDEACKLWLSNGNIPSFTISTTLNSAVTISSTSSIAFDEWHHVTGVYDNASGNMSLYIDGVEVSTGSTNGAIATTASSNGNFEIGRLSSSVSNQQYFKGDIDEVRVFNTALETLQVQRMVYQEIEELSGNVSGSIIPKEITDSTLASISWSNLIGYYPMTDIDLTSDIVDDYSGNGNDLSLYNISTIVEQTAPLPYESETDGLWTSESTWLHGNVWDIEDVPNNKDWSIVKISSEVATTNSHTNLGLIIDSGSTLNISGEQSLTNTWYLELNGTLDLEDDCQLLQSTNSDLVSSASGKLLRRQEGTSNAYRYNYWSSPVGALGSTSLLDDNASTNNTNNSDFTLNMLKDGAENPMTFTSGYTGSGSISTYWLYTYKNGVTYWDWSKIGTSTNIPAGVGYTQKGTGVSGTEQAYIFEGKPNNGTVKVSVSDVGGSGSKTDYLLGNPYPSAIDVHQFIDDNKDIIGGFIYLWQQWSGDSHYLNEYNAGYATVNKTGGVRAFQFVGIYGGNNGSKDGTKHPTRYLPVSQGFIVEIVDDGEIEFNNGQRVFVLESDADGTDYNGSVFFKGNSSKDNSTKEDDDSTIQKLRIELNSVSGTDTRRELLLGFSNYTTDEYDYGYDAKLGEITSNDISLDLNGENMLIQAYGEITSDKIVPLNFRSSGDNTFEIQATELIDFDDDQEVYLKDNLTGTYFDLTSGEAYSFTTSQGIFNERFQIVFQNETQQALSTDDTSFNSNYIYYQNSNKTFYVKNLTTDVKNIALINMRGQTMLELENVSASSLNNGIQLNVSTGAYIISMRTDSNEVLTKKIIVN
ncbi:LamG-like jellyroll fold domain-containing protein [Neotamlana laminarinivorans]|uniref:DUF11 domain-containing protein n=1 Tax=Neotamlana laminarinivorans TaxID=2883124 RepID=A0A9X1I0F0_9FLAO|nr:LamG-like jellyroll fold domain-containing protein [Tamlana laminarinivorans]MCB4797992.1 DUF11 domain-containing protein [Tamlana laminarinivorans]